MRWLPIIRQWHAEYPDLDPAWILAIIAQESMGEPDVISSDRVGSVGLMQIAPFAWRPSPSQLQNPSINIRWGMGILDELQNRYGNLRLSLATYNCGEANLAKGWCGNHGGYAYADVVINHWVPIFRDALRQIADGSYPNIFWMDMKEWLTSLGYLSGSGRWKREEAKFWDVLCLGYRYFRICMV